MIDYTLSTNEEIIKSKCLKGYQGKKKVLLIVSLFAGSSNPIPIPQDIPYKKNVFILDMNSWIRLFRFQNDDSSIDEIRKIISLTKYATYDDVKMKKLLKVSQMYEAYIKFRLEYSQEEFMTYLTDNRKQYLLENPDI